jgi:hypothetical protein
MRALRVAQRTVLSVFICMNIATVLLANSPAQLYPAVENAALPYAVRYGAWLVMQYAHLTGLDNQWRMFSHNSRFNWRFLIRADYTDGSQVVLPLPRQSRRTFWQWLLVDFKEAKFHLNIYSKPQGRVAYSRYLCRRYAAHNGAPAVAIVWELDYQNILNPEEAGRRGTHLEPQRRREPLHTVSCGRDDPGASASHS